MKRGPGRPPGSRNKSPDEYLPHAEIPEKALNKLPSDKTELDRVLMPAKLVVRPAIGAVSRVFRHLKVEELDKEEQESGTQAFAALAYQYWGEMDARYMVAIWTTSVVLPRLYEFLERKERENKSPLQLAKENLEKPKPVEPPAAA